MPHKFRASQMGYYKQCPGRWISSHGLPEETSEYAARGTRIHKAFEQYFSQGTAPNLPDDELDLCSRAIDEWKRISDGCERDFCETEVTLLNDADLGSCGGTCDAYCVMPDESIEVFDLKTGWNPLPEEAVRFQLAIYLGAVMTAEDAQNGRATAYQPVNGNSVTVELTESDIWGVAEACLEVMQECVNEAIVLNPNEEACKYCLARRTCPGSRRVSTEIEAISHPKDVLGVLSREKRGELVSKAKHVEALVKETLAAAKDMLIKNPDAIEGFKLQERKNIALVRDK